MLKLILILVPFFLTGTVSVESIYIHSVTSTEGDNKPLSAYQGKKILIITLPVQQSSSNDSLLHSLDSLRDVQGSSLVIIGVPAYEDGYTASIKESLRQWYRRILSMKIIITKGLLTRKTSGNQQHPLFKWLTDKTKNDHFDKDITGPRNKFIVWTDSTLIGVLAAPTRIGSNTVNDQLQ